MKKLYTLTLMLFFAVSLSGTTKFVINNGHFSPIISIQYDVGRDLIFSAEEKGAISIWNKSTETLRNHFQLTSNIIDRILVSPTEDNIAVLSHDSEKYYLSVWNWNTERQVFPIRMIEEQPLFLEYSASGRYLFYGNVKNPSLTFLNARNGVQLNYMNQLPSIYDFGYLGSTEKNLMTYSSSGAIKFYDFRTSEEKKNVETISGLKNLQVIQSNNAYLSAYSGHKVYLIERLTGRATDTMEFNELKNFYQNSENGHALTVERVNRNYVLKKWSTDNDKFTVMEKPVFIPATVEISSLAEADGMTLAGDTKGTLYKVNWSTASLDLFSSDNTKNIHDISISGNSLTLSGENGLLTIEAPFFNNSLSVTTSPAFTQHQNPLQGKTGLLEIGDNKLLLWNTDVEKGSISIFNTRSNTTEFKYSNFTSPIQDIRYEEGKIITLEKNGTIKIINIENSQEVFSYSAIGLQNISMVDEETLFAGRSSTSGQSPAVTININTRETLIVNDDRFLIFDSMAVRKNHQFYTLGLLNDNNKIKTILKSHDYENLSDMETLVIYNGEDINAQVLIDPSNSSTIYAKLGTSGIYKITGRNVTKYTNNKPVDKIYLSGSILYSLNQDNSITLFKASTGQILYTIYIFKDDKWALIPASSDMYFGSEGVEENILSYRNNRFVNLAPSNTN
jgi:hypothetical protein